MHSEASEGQQRLHARIAILLPGFFGAAISLGVQGQSLHVNAQSDGTRRPAHDKINAVDAAARCKFGAIGLSHCACSSAGMNRVMDLPLSVMTPVHEWALFKRLQRDRHPTC